MAIPGILERMDEDNEWQYHEGYDIHVTKETKFPSANEQNIALELRELVTPIDYVLLEILADLTFSDVETLLEYIPHFVRRRKVSVYEVRQTVINRMMKMAELGLCVGKSQRKDRSSKYGLYDKTDVPMYCLSESGLHYLRAKRDFDRFVPIKLPAYHANHWYETIAANRCALLLARRLDKELEVIVRGSSHKKIGREILYTYAHLEIPARNGEPYRHVLFVPTFYNRSTSVYSEDMLSEAFGKKAEDVSTLAQYLTEKTWQLHSVQSEVYVVAVLDCLGRSRKHLAFSYRNFGCRMAELGPSFHIRYTTLSCMEYIACTDELFLMVAEKTEENRTAVSICAENPFRTLLAPKEETQM